MDHMNRADILRWHLWSGSRIHQGRVERALEVVHRAVATGRFLLSWSGGKDSTAMVHLVRSVAPDTPILIQFDDCDWPEKKPYVERVCAAQGWVAQVVEAPFSVWERVRLGQIGEDDFCSPSHPLTQDAFLGPLSAAQRELGAEGVFLGLREEESRARRLNLRLRGPLYKVKNGDWHCCPLAYWTAQDVFAYLVAHEIDINPCYGQNRFLPPEEIRISWAIPTPTNMGRGAIEHLRHYYPRQFRQLRAMGVC
jgi:3'-phosphoadenosine 5'-phosphosulfate sulfotransferase (PAPS reductase)/FAD synthetase